MLWSPKPRQCSSSLVQSSHRCRALTEAEKAVTVAKAEAEAEAQLALIDGLEADLHALQCQKVELGACCLGWEG